MFLIYLFIIKKHVIVVGIVVRCGRIPVINATVDTEKGTVQWPEICP